MIKKMITTKIKSTWLGTVKTKQCNCTKLISELWHIAMNIKMWHCCYWGQSGRISRGIWIWEDILRSSSGLILERVEEYMEVFVLHWHIFWLHFEVGVKMLTDRLSGAMCNIYSDIIPISCQEQKPLCSIFDAGSRRPSTKKVHIRITRNKQAPTDIGFFFRHASTFGQGQSQIRT